LEIILPFSDHSALRDSMIRTDGITIRYGKLFEILDGLAGDVAYRHCGGRTDDLTIVTASVDGMKASANIDINNDLKLQGYLTYVGKSSMEVFVQ
jgi:acyl-coenzyme A thioesterase 9